VSKELKSARIDKINSSLIDALIKMMLVDDITHKNELEQIAEIYFLLFGKKASMEDLEARILKVSEEDDLTTVGVIADSIADSIRSQSSKEAATHALIDVMLSDEIVHEKEKVLIKKIAKLWGTTEIIDSVLNDT
tara:strand:+ start:4716 stop:5120 length:405 start_codon:yes stop_codon:yes gene_type:complete